MTHLPSCQRPQAKKAPRILWLSSPSIYLSAHPSIHSYESISLSESPGFVWYLSVSLYTTKAHSSSCQDSVVSSLNVRVGITQSALFVIKVMGNGYIGVSAENRIFFIFSLANTAGTYVCLEKIPVYSVHLNYYVTVVFICASFGAKTTAYDCILPHILMANYFATEYLGLAESHWSLQSLFDMPNYTPDLIYACCQNFSYHYS